ncbi:hypothetical protein [Bradyrhizobium sp. CCBAU 051011]|uniref:hypothetical protein n=1 Tax=Bradyrhizobium sp. CCBAU 051011 TaxID=858422 RepID=UPI00352B1494
MVAGNPLGGFSRDACRAFAELAVSGLFPGIAGNDNWARQIPRDAISLWTFVAELDHDSRMALFAHCVALTVNAVKLPWDRRPRALAAADRLAEAVALDMTSCWRPTVRSCLGRVTKAGILEAVREGVGEEATERMSAMTKADMRKPQSSCWRRRAGSRRCCGRPRRRGKPMCKARRKAASSIRKLRNEASAGAARAAPAGSKILATCLMARGWFDRSKVTACRRKPSLG